MDFPHPEPRCRESEGNSSHVSICRKTSPEDFSVGKTPYWRSCLLGLCVTAPGQCLLSPERNRDRTVPFSQAETFSTKGSLRLRCCLNSKRFLNTGKSEARQKAVAE